MSEHAARFHLAFPVSDIGEAKAFYVDGLGCEIGRESAHSIILNLFGHQLVAHETNEPLPPPKGIYPRHFGLVFDAEADWESLLARAQAHRLKFYQPARTRFLEQIIEHRTFFLEDPSHNLLEFKFYRHAEAVFGAHAISEIGDR